MASYKSQSGLPIRADAPALHSYRPQTTRLPQPSVVPALATTSQLAVRSQSRTQRKRATRDEQAPPPRGATNQPVSVPVSSAGIKVRDGNAPSRAVLQTPSSRLPKLEVTENSRNPSLLSASSTSTVDSRSTALRRKPTSIGINSDVQTASQRDGSMSSREDSALPNPHIRGFKDPFSQTVLGISVPPSSSVVARSDLEVEVARNLYYDCDLDPVEALPLPTPQYALSTTPSTRYSESPGPFSVSSTPTSMSSYSPGTAISTKSGTRVRQPSPLESRPPIVRQKTSEDIDVRQRQGLSAVRASSNSSSSASTVVALPDGGKPRERASRQQPPPPLPNSSLKANVKHQAPPELAHLADPPLATSQPRRPVRPSRSGTVEMMGLREPSPIIQSNMSSFPTPHRRTSSTESRSGISLGSRARFGLPIRAPSRNPSPSPVSASAPTPPTRLLTRGPTPDLHTNPQRTHSRATSGTAPSPSKPHRFGFFRRKTDPETLSTVKPEKKASRRGPVAGTGHEGYSRYAVRVRSGSSGSGSSIGRSASAGTTSESLNRTSTSRKSSVTGTTSADIDDFIRDRLVPVTIRGNGSSAELTSTPKLADSGSSRNASSPHGQGSKGPNLPSKAIIEKKLPTLLPSAMSDPVRGTTPRKRMPLDLRRPSESDEDMKKSLMHSFTARRTSRTSKLLDGAPLPSKNACDSSVGASSKARLRKEKAEKPSSKPSKKWNFFQRAHASSKEESPVARPPPVASTKARSVAHYALVDSRVNIDLEDIEQLIQDADSGAEEQSMLEGPLSVSLSSGNDTKKERLRSMLLPPKPILSSDIAVPGRPDSPKVYLCPEQRADLPHRTLSIDTNFQPMSGTSQADLTPVTDLSSPPSPISPIFRPKSPVEHSVLAAPSVSACDIPIVKAHSLPGPLPKPPTLHILPRPSRLPQVGRIPRVVPRRVEEHKPPPLSFSRPFASNQAHRNVPNRTSFDSMGSVPVTCAPVEHYPVLRGIGTLHHGEVIARPSPDAVESSRQSEFFRFPPRKDSEVSHSSSSEAWGFPRNVGTAVPPAAGVLESEDEVWGEYDDLIDEVLSPASPRPEDKTVRNLKSCSAKASCEVEEVGLAADDTSKRSLHLRRSRLLAVLYSAQTPTSPISLSDYLQDLGDRNLSVVDPVTGRLSFPASVRLSTHSGLRDRPDSARSSFPTSLSLNTQQSKATFTSGSDNNRESASTNRYRDTRLMELAEAQTDGFVSMADLRFGALMTSKWLSFGRVVFSPAHFELKNPEEDRVLVIDGLGKDWSYYCALTYSEASIYNLSAGPRASATVNNAAEPWSTLNNHHHVSMESLTSSFPFPGGFFACVVLRFPPALPSHMHRFIISECKRVLQPGGHLEFSVLDLDLVNMGNLARRAVRGLKVKMQVADPNVSLRNISDEIMASIGRRGFTECNRCFVGVPVAGRLPSCDDNAHSPDATRTGSSAITDSLQRTKSTKSTTSSRVSTSKKPKSGVSFSDLLNRHASSDSVDQGITDMVARVGRWWYSRCYESLVLPEAAVDSANLLENSIWRDEGLIRECEKRGTTFRLLIGYAQKPEVGVRRTVSV